MFYVFLLLNSKGQFEGVFKKKDNAISAIPQYIRNFQKQVREGYWVFGETEQWHLHRKRIEDGNDLPT